MISMIRIFFAVFADAKKPYRTLPILSIGQYPKTALP